MQLLIVIGKYLELERKKKKTISRVRDLDSI